MRQVRKRTLDVFTFLLCLQDMDTSAHPLFINVCETDIL